MSDEETAQAVLEPFLLSYRDDGASKIWLAPVDCAPLKAAIVAALQAERERCAKVAEETTAYVYEKEMTAEAVSAATKMRQNIAAAIRAPLSKSQPEGER